MKTLRLSHAHAAALLSLEKKVARAYTSFTKKLKSFNLDESVVEVNGKKVLELLDEWVRLFVADPTTKSRKRILSVDEERILLLSTAMTLGSALTFQWTAKQFIDAARPSYPWLVDYA